MAMPIATSPRNNPSHAMLHKIHDNVKAYGAAGDGVADDTAEIQAAIDAATALGGTARVALPRGDYITSSTLTLNGAGGSLRISGASSRNAEGTPGASGAGARIIANFNGPIFERTDTGDGAQVIIEDLAVWNTHNTGSGIKLAKLLGGSGVYRCNVRANQAVAFGANCLSSGVFHCHITRNGTFAGSRGILLSNHCDSYLNDVSGFAQGIASNGIGSNIHGGRVEVCEIGIVLFSPFTGGTVSGVSLEANDTGISAAGVFGMNIFGCSILGTAGSPSGSSDYGIDIGEVFGGAITGVREGGTHTAAFIRVGGLPNRYALAFMGVYSGTAWDIVTNKSQVTIINCEGVDDIVRAPVIATASLPAAAAGEDGRLVIEDNGAGDRNLILYAGGQRFKIDGGAAI